MAKVSTVDVLQQRTAKHQLVGEILQRRVENGDLR